MSGSGWFRPSKWGWMNSRLKCNTILEEYLIGSFKAQAFSGGIVVLVDEVGQGAFREGIEVGFSGQHTAEAADGVFDAAFLPGRMGVAVPGLDAVLAGEQIMLAELRAVVEGHGAIGAGRQ